jgi:hypothetical protein
MGINLTLTFQSLNGTRNVGWSETVNFAGADLDAFKVAAYAAGGYVANRLQLLGAGVVNTSGRITATSPGIPPYPSVRRNVRPVGGYPPYTSSPTGSALNVLPYYNTDFYNRPADFSGTVFMSRWFTSSNAPPNPSYSRTFWIAGMPDDSQVITNPLEASPSVNTALTLYTGSLVRQGVQIRTIDRSAANPVIQCTAYNAGVYTVTSTSGMKIGGLVEAVNFKGQPGGTAPRGQYRIVSFPTNTQVTINSKNVPLSLATLGGFRVVSYVELPIVTAILRYFSQKKHGRPFGQPVGRRRAPAIARA